MVGYIIYHFYVYEIIIIIKLISGRRVMMTI